MDAAACCQAAVAGIRNEVQGAARDRLLRELATALGTPNAKSSTFKAMIAVISQLIWPERYTMDKDAFKTHDATPRNYYHWRKIIRPVAMEILEAEASNGSGEVGLTAQDVEDAMTVLDASTQLEPAAHRNLSDALLSGDPLGLQDHVDVSHGSLVIGASDAAELGSQLALPLDGIDHDPIVGSGPDLDFSLESLEQMGLGEAVRDAARAASEGYLDANEISTGPEEHCSSDAGGNTKARSNHAEASAAAGTGSGDDAANEDSPRARSGCIEDTVKQCSAQPITCVTCGPEAEPDGAPTASSTAEESGSTKVQVTDTTSMSVLAAAWEGLRPARCKREGCRCVSYNGLPGEYCGHSCRGSYIRAGFACRHRQHDEGPGFIVHPVPMLPPPREGAYDPRAAGSGTLATYAACARAECPCIASHDGIEGHFCCISCRDGKACGGNWHTKPQRRPRKGIRTSTET